MDTFFEQIVSIRKSTGKILLQAFIWLMAFLLSAFFILFLSRIAIIGFFSVLLAAAVLFGAYKLSSLLNIEYEYIITNGTMDIDKIVNKSSRKRILSFELPEVTRIDKFNPATQNMNTQKNLVFACEPNNPAAYLMVCEKEGKPATYLVFAPDERIKSAVIKFVPKFVSNSAFK